MNAPLPVVIALVLGLGAQQAGRVTSQANARLNPKIPAPIESQYRGIQDAKDWRNPALDIAANGITVRSLSLRDGRKTTSTAELRATLIGLPVTDWPYGRVAAASDPSIRRGDRREDQAITRNHATAEEVLKELDIRANWWPPEPRPAPDRAPMAPAKGWRIR